MEVSLSTNGTQYRDALIDFMVQFRKGVKETILYQGRLLGERLIKFTPPRNKAQGRARVDKDIRKVILGLDTPAEFDQAHAVIKGDTNIVRAFVDKKGVVYGVDKTLYKPDAQLADLDQFHQKNRLKSGRVTDAGTKTKDIGRWKFLTKLVVRTSVLDEYISAVQDRVGSAKGGWAAGPLKLGSDVPGWIAEHANKGEFIDGSDAGDPFLVFTNRSEWASGGDEDRVMENAIEGRTRDIMNSIIAARKHASHSLFFG